MLQAVVLAGASLHALHGPGGQMEEQQLQQHLRGSVTEVVGWAAEVASPGDPGTSKLPLPLLFIGAGGVN